MDQLQITIVGPGRAGMALALACRGAGHRVAAVVGRDRGRTAAAAASVDAVALALHEPLPGGDLLVLAVSDDAIAPVAQLIGTRATGYSGVVHLSGFVTLDAMAAFDDVGVATGSFHPLQTMPTPETGAARMAGAWVGITASEPLRTLLRALASSLGAEPFDLVDGAKPVYHAAAAAAANLPLAALTMASDLFDAAGVPFAAAEPLVTAVVANAFELGPRSALTGPVARGDVGTVVGQLRAVARERPEWVPGFVAFVREIARISGRSAEFDELTGGGP